MMTLSLQQAVRNAIESELEAARFYDYLVTCTEDERVQNFFIKMAESERQHAESIQRIEKRLEIQTLSEQPKGQIQLVEASPLWEYADDIRYPDALLLALEAEQHAQLFYSAMADQLQGEVKTFFEQLSEQENQHAIHLQRLIEQKETST